jgi:CDP-glucose 4,6-dehydratase
MRHGRNGEYYMINLEFWKGKKVFLTGHTGFKGSWMAMWLHSMGATVKGYALAPSTNPNLFDVARVSGLIESDINDIRNYSVLSQSILKFSPDIVFHMAAQPLVRASYARPLETYEINVMGTANLLNAVLQCRSVQAVVNVTTDKCYENKEWYWGYRENEPMGGRDPYSSSKGCSELVTAAYRDSYLLPVGVGVATARAGNVIGGGDWAEDRLIPDTLKAFEEGKPVVVRNPSAIRPWQHVLEPISGYLLLAESLFSEPSKFSSGWNFGPYDGDVQSVGWIVNNMTKLWPGSTWTLDEDENPHEAMLLKLDISKAATGLNWTPTWSLKETLGCIVGWQKLWIDKNDMRYTCLNEITKYCKDMNRGKN